MSINMGSADRIIRAIVGIQKGERATNPIDSSDKGIKVVICAVVKEV